MSSALASVIESTRRSIQVGTARLQEREVELTEAERYARDPLAWIDAHVVIGSKFDETGQRGRVRPLKMRLFPDQKTTIGEWIDLERLAATGELEFGNVLVEKSRQIGETWALAACVTWLLHYHRTRGLFMHQRAAEVADRGWTIDSFMGRVRWINDRLDPARTPGLGRLVFRPGWTEPATVENVLTGALVRGEPQRDDPGRGSTFDWAIVDEAAHVQHGELVHAAIDDAAVTGKLYLSTPRGDDNMHARLCDERPQGWAYLRIHWSTHPVYGQDAHIAGDDPGCQLCAGVRAGLGWDAQNPRAHRYPGKLTSPWYDQAVVGKTNEQVAGELDIDRAGALTARVYPEFETSLHVTREPIELVPGLGCELAWDFGLDVTSIVVIQNTSDAVNVVGLLEAGDLLGTSGTPADVSAELTGYLAELGFAREDVTRQLGDPSEQHRSTVTGRSKLLEWRRYGWDIEAPRRQLVSTTITAVKLLLAGTPKHMRVCGVRVREFQTHMLNNVWPTDAAGQRRVAATAPLDNLHNHACRAFAYWAAATYPPAGQHRATLSVARGTI